MINQIIAQVPESDRNIYITIEDGMLTNVNYSQGLGEIDSDFFINEKVGLFKYVIDALNEQGDELYSAEFFFPSPYWDEQVYVIDSAISKMIQDQRLAEDKLKELTTKIQLMLVEQSKIGTQIDNIKAQIKIIGGTYGI